MSYVNILSWQERLMNDALCGPWYGSRSEREAYRSALVQLRAIIVSLT
jgi:hypothetical protein